MVAITTTQPLGVYIAAELRAEMSRQGKTVSGIALALGVNRKTLGDTFRGKRAITANELEQIADALDLNPTAVVQSAEARREAGRAVA